MTVFIVAPQLFSSLGRLTANEQARVIDFIKTFQANPANPGVSLERITRNKSKGLWSGRVTRDLRAVLHKDGETWALLHADHHDAAYSWAERRDVGRHSVTGALQIVETVESVREVERVIEVHVEPDAPPLLERHADDYLLTLGVPESWIPTLRSVNTDDQLLVVCEKLPEDVAERLLALAAGEFVTPPTPLPPDRPAIESADTRRRFFVIEDAEGLAAALEAPMDRWIAFLHPSQRELVEKRRAEYATILAEPHPEWVGERVESCPMCDGGKLERHLESRDRYHTKPGGFRLDRCADCGHLFQNPRLTPEGLAFYYADFYEGVGGSFTQRIFAHDDKVYTKRAKALEGLAHRRPKRWLDVGTGFAHFPNAICESWPGTSFEGVDQSESVRTAERRRWIDKAHYGRLTELAGDLAGRYDVVSMNHYLETGDWDIEYLPGEEPAPEEDEAK